MKQTFFATPGSPLDQTTHSCDGLAWAGEAVCSAESAAPDHAPMLAATITAPTPTRTNEKVAFRINHSFQFTVNSPIWDCGDALQPADFAAQPLRMVEGEDRGLVLIRAFMDEVQFNDAGNQVTLIKRRRGDW
ncbi:MAG: ATP-binding protein [Planctomycetota bacterium]